MLQTTYKNIILVLTIIIIITSCTPAYIPNALNTPLLSEKGEFQAAINTGVSGIDPQFAYAATDNIGIMLNGSIKYRNKLDSMQDNYHNHFFIESGVGYYNALGEAGRFETFCGFGLGNVDAHFYNYHFSSYAKANYHKFFIQPSIGATTNVFDGSFSTRLVMVYINLDKNSFKEYYKNAYVYYFEPVMTGRIGYKNVKFSAQVGFSLPINKLEKIYYQYQPFILSVGIHITLGNKFFKTNNKNYG